MTGGTTVTYPRLFCPRCASGMRKGDVIVLVELEWAEVTRTCYTEDLDGRPMRLHVWADGDLQRACR